MKVGDLAEFGASTILVCTKVRTYCLSLQEIGSPYPPHIMDHSHVGALIKKNKMRIISKAQT